MKHIGYITLPVYEHEDRELTGLRQNMLDAGPHALSTGAGLGTDGIWAELETDGHMVYRQVAGRDVLAAVAQLARQPDADRFPTTTDYKDQRHDP